MSGSRAEFDPGFLCRAQKAGLQELQGHSKKVHTVGWSSDGKRLASGSVDKTVNIWKVGASGAPATLEHELQGHTEAVDQLTWDPSNPDQLASASSDKSVRIWDGRMGKCAAMIPTKGENINIAWSPDGTTIAVGDKADQVSFIDKRTHAIIGKPWAFKTEMNELSWNNTGNLFFLTTGNGTVEVHTWGAAGSAAGPGKPIASLPAHTQSCYCIKFDSRDKHFAVGSADALVSIWDLSTFTCVRTIDRLEWPVRTLGFSADGQFLAAGSEDLFIDVCSVATGEQLHQIPCDAATNALAWSPRDPVLAFAGEGSRDRDRDRPQDAVKIFGMKDGRCV